jgi:hypothetical protein
MMWKLPGLHRAQSDGQAGCNCKSALRLKQISISLRYIGVNDGRFDAIGLVMIPV